MPDVVPTAIDGPLRAPIVDPRGGDAEDDASSTTSRSLSAIAGSLLAEISIGKLLVAWLALVIVPGLLLDVPAGPFYGFNRPGATPIQPVIQNWWRQGMMGGANAHYEGIKVFSETDFTDDLKSITVPTFVVHGDDDQIVPIADAALLSIKLLKNGTLKVYEKSV